MKAFLGVQTGRELDWKAQIGSLFGSILRYCYALRVISENVNIEAGLAAHHAYVQSILRRGVLFWDDLHRKMVMPKGAFEVLIKLNTKRVNLFLFNKIS